MLKLAEQLKTIPPFSVFEGQFLNKLVGLGIVKQIPMNWHYDLKSSPERFYFVTKGTFEFIYAEGGKKFNKSVKVESVQDLKPFMIQEKQISKMDRIKI